MNIKEMNELCADCQMYETLEFTARDMITAFVRVNIDDELYEQEEENNTPSELVFDEYTEMIARCWNGLVWRHLFPSQRRHLDPALELQTWLVDIFLPRAMQCTAARMKEQKKAWQKKKDAAEKQKDAPAGEEKKKDAPALGRSSSSQSAVKGTKEKKK
eukprot:7381869-Prymnesium_polylepis.2